MGKIYYPKLQVYNACPHNLHLSLITARFSTAPLHLDFNDNRKNLHTRLRKVVEAKRSFYCLMYVNVLEKKYYPTSQVFTVYRELHDCKISVANSFFLFAIFFFLLWFSLKLRNYSHRLQCDANLPMLRQQRSWNIG